MIELCILAIHLLRPLNYHGQCYTYDLIKIAVKLFKETGFSPQVDIMFACVNK